MIFVGHRYQISFRLCSCCALIDVPGSQPTDALDHTSFASQVLMFTLSCQPPHVCNRQRDEVVSIGIQGRLERSGNHVVSRRTAVRVSGRRLRSVPTGAGETDFWCFLAQKDFLWMQNVFSGYKKLFLTFSEVKGSHQLKIVWHFGRSKTARVGSIVGDPKSSRKQWKAQTTKAAQAEASGTNSSTKTRQQQHMKKTPKGSVKAAAAAAAAQNMKNSSKSRNSIWCSHWRLFVEFRLCFRGFFLTTRKFYENWIMKFCKVKREAIQL